MAGKILIKKQARKPVTGKIVVKKSKTSPAKQKKGVTSSIQTKSARVMKEASAKRAKKNLPARKETSQEKEVRASGVYTVKDRNKRIGSVTLGKLSELSGYPIESEQFVVVVEIVKGADNRQEVNHRVRDLMPESPRTETPKSVSNLVSAVVTRMITNGFTIEGNWKMITPA